MTATTVRQVAAPVARLAQRASLEHEVPRQARFLAGLLKVRELPLDTRALEAKIIAAHAAGTEER